MKFESLVDKVFDKYDEIFEIYVNHPLPYGDSSLYMKIITPEVEPFQKWLDIEPTEPVTIELPDGDSVDLPIMVLATWDGPGNVQGPAGTSIYLSEDVLDGPRDIETGLSMFRKKVNGKCPTCDEEVDKLSHHYLENTHCRNQDLQN